MAVKKLRAGRRKLQKGVGVEIAIYKGALVNGGAGELFWSSSKVGAQTRSERYKTRAGGIPVAGRHRAPADQVAA